MTTTEDKILELVPTVVITGTSLKLMDSVLKLGKTRTRRVRKRKRSKKK